MAAGKFADAVAKGRVFSISTVVAGLAIPISTTTAPTVLLWNPQDSGVRFNLVRYVIGWASGASVPSNIGFQSFSVGSQGMTNKTGAAISAFAASAIKNALIGSGAVSKAKASAAGTNTIVAVVDFLATGLNLSTGAATGVNPPGSAAVYDFDGLYQLLPGQACFPCGNAASGALIAQTLYWEEVPLNDQ